MKEKEDVTSVRQDSNDNCDAPLMVQNTIEHLLKPRYKVIADWPDSKCEVDDIILLENDSSDNIWRSSSEYAGFYKREMAISTFQKYPHLFQKLEWWEERTPNEMPNYVRFIKDYMNFKKDSVYKYSDWNKEGDTSDCIGFITGSGRYDKAAVPPIFNQLMPATKEDYDRFMLNSEQGVKESDTTMLNSSTEADNPLPNSPVKEDWKENKVNP